MLAIEDFEPGQNWKVAALRIPFYVLAFFKGGFSYMKNNNIHEKYMQLALKQANKAYKSDEVPVGAVIVKDNEVIGLGHNTNERSQSPLKHAEMNTIEQAVKMTNNKNLSGSTIYVTLEPCMMCLGAIMNAKIDNIYFGAFDLEYGNLISNEHYKLNKDIKWHSGILQEECSQLLSDYFKKKRRDD